eukprot:g6003.t1
MLALLGITNIHNYVNEITDFHSVWDTALPQRSTDSDVEVYPYKKTLVTYYNLNNNISSSERSTLHNYRGSEHPILGRKCVVEQVDSTTATTGSAHATHGRIHRAFPVEVDTNPIQLKLHKLLYDILQCDDKSGKIEKDNGDTEFIWENMQSAFRVVKSKTKHGEPGPEGVHQDSCTLTVIILMDRKNVTFNSGGNRVWKLDQIAGKPTLDDINTSEKLLTQVILREQFDALFVMDRKAKHEALPIEIDDNNDVAIRDVLTFEVRRREKKTKI